MERYETVVEKLRECEQELEAAKEAAAEVVASFDDVKNRRLSLFQVT
jgi:chromosome segregation ATPase